MYCRDIVKAAFDEAGKPVVRNNAARNKEKKMNIDFGSMNPDIKEDFKGGSGKLGMKASDDGNVRIMELMLEPGASIGMHTHEGDCEIVYILSGTGKAVYDGGEEKLEPGICHYCPEGHSHSIMNDGSSELRFFAVVPKR